MKFEMVLPEMGESVQEATIVKWLVGIGDLVAEDDTILEVATDKVDSEVPAPIAGKIVELRVAENDVAAIGAVVAIIEAEASGAASAAKTPAKANKSETKTETETKSSGPSRVAIELPEMGESVLEASVNNWLIAVGDIVSVDQTIVEVSTDKVDSEVPSPYAGKIVEICVKEGLVAKIGEPIAYIETSDAETSSPSISENSANTQRASVSEAATSTTAPAAVIANGSNNGFFSPLVKNIAKTEGIPLAELANVQGTGSKNRLTKKDMLSYVKNRGAMPPPAAPVAAAQGTGNFPHAIAPVNVSYDPARVTLEPMSTMRKGIAKHMVQSLYTAPHVFSIHEVNMKRIWDWRNAVKGKFKVKYGFNLTFTHIIMELVAKAIQKNPKINSSIQGDTIIVRKDINLGMAVGFTAKDGDNGLIVPVIKNIDELKLIGVAKQAAELTNKARKLQIKPDDTAGGTFTVTNVGTFGTEVGLGIINQPQVAILSLGNIVKKPIVTKDDAIMIAPMMKMALSYDHRVVDGMLGGQFLFDLQEMLENYEGDSGIV